MRTFFGGQILKECRGDLAVVVERIEDSKGYAVFMYPILSDEFINLTGVRMAKNTTERVYTGVSHDAGVKLGGLFADCGKTQSDLREIDKSVVEPFFWDKYLEKPEKITLRARRWGYEIVDE